MNLCSSRAVAFAVFLLALAGFAEAQAAPPELGPPVSASLWTDFSLQGTASKAHRALGYITPTLGLATYLTMLGEKGNAPSGGHQLLGRAAGWAAGATLGLGLIAHWDRLSFSLDPQALFTMDNLHALVAGTGAACMVTAAVLGGQDHHAFFGEAGTFLMGTAILLEW